MSIKIQFYIISLWFLFFFLFLAKINIPTEFNCCQLAGWADLIKTNIFPLICIFMMLLGIIFYIRLDYVIIKGAKTLPREIKKIENINFETLSFLATYII